MSDSMYVQSSGPGMMSGTNVALAVVGILALVALILAATHHGDDKHDSDAGVKVLKKRVSPGLTVGNHLVNLGKIPANSRITELYIITRVVSVGGTGADIDYKIGIATDDDKIVAPGTAGTELIMRNAGAQGNFDAVNDFHDATIVGGQVNTFVELDLNIIFTVTDAALTTAGSYDVLIYYEPL